MDSNSPQPSNLSMTGKPPFPPFTREAAIQKARMAENAYAEDSFWRNRSEFIRGRDEILQFLKRKWATDSSPGGMDHGLMISLV